MAEAKYQQAVCGGRGCHDGKRLLLQMLPTMAAKMAAEAAHTGIDAGGQRGRRSVGAA